MRTPPGSGFRSGGKWARGSPIPHQESKVLALRSGILLQHWSAS
jgi:hypothetical protein